MSRYASPFVFTISAPPGEARGVRSAWFALSTRILEMLPDAAVLIVSTRLGVSILDRDGAPLDLSTLPWPCIEEAVSLLGTGAFVLPGEGVRGSDVQEPWVSDPKARKRDAG